MIKYEIKKIPFVEGFVMTEFEYKTVSKSELQSYLNNGWTLHRKKYFIFTEFIDWWKTLSVGNKIAIFAILVSALMAYIMRDSINIAIYPKTDSNSSTTDYYQEVNSDTINYEPKSLTIKPSKDKITETEKISDCDLKTLVEISSLLEKGTELNDQNYAIFFANMNPDCSNNAEYSEFNNELIFKTLESNPKKFVAFLSRVSKKKKILEFVLTQLRNPIHDGIELNAIYKRLDKSETEDAKTKELVSESIKKAIEKNK